jgi:hypothetical protein
LPSLQAAFQMLGLPSPFMRTIAEKIWKNECAKTIKGLTSWNVGEPFASMGIGHFIWFPSYLKVPFHETFRDLLKFIQTDGYPLPAWLKPELPCPWNTKAEFDAQLDHPKMVELRTFLYHTIDYQALFIAKRLSDTLPKIVEKLTPMQKESALLFYETPKGLYALTDYLNFKGDGLDPNEAYKGQGWGLLQVLSFLPKDRRATLQDFAEAASFVLERRIHNAPAARAEERWLPGWLSRIGSYL